MLWPILWPTSSRCGRKHSKALEAVVNRHYRRIGLVSGCRCGRCAIRRPLGGAHHLLYVSSSNLGIIASLSWPFLQRNPASQRKLPRSGRLSGQMNGAQRKNFQASVPSSYRGSGPGHVMVMAAECCPSTGRTYPEHGCPTQHMLGTGCSQDAMAI